MFRFIVLIILIHFSYEVAVSETVYLPSGSLPAETINPYPGLGTNAVTGESYVIPGKTYTETYTGLPSALPSTTSTTSTTSSLSSIFPAGTLLPNLLDEEAFDSTFTSTPETAGELYLSRIPNGKRTGMFQKANFNALWAPNSGGRKGLGVTQLDLSAMFALPLTTPDSPLIITPSFQTTFFDPKISSIATNKALYTTGFDFRWIKPVVRNKWTFDLGVAVQYSGDFKVEGSKALRFPAHIATVWNCNPRLKVILGVVYLDRKDDYNWLPMAGLIWTPQEEISVELVFPRIRIAERVYWFGSAASDESSDWVYAAFELGGGSWGYENQRIADSIEYRDLKLLLGYERRCASGMTLGFEFGYMFERKYELDRIGYNIHPADCVFIRIRTSF
ncbi:MAG: hypothetical protein LBF88_00460 [Planctomycetaceae bacterium]|jgi:hypothetical protein|nr:hypothetical protein [Planctomycetaceae bacterium]